MDMTTTADITAPKGTAPDRVPISSLRKTALVAGVIYLITFVSIPTLSLYGPVRNNPSYILGQGPDTPILTGALLEVIVAWACIGTAVVLYPVIKRQHEGVALGFVGARVLEAATIFAGVVSLLTVVTLRQSAAGPDALAVGQALVAFNNWTFLLGQSFLPVVNALLLGSLLYRSRLVPRMIPLVGLIGAPLLLTSDVGVLFGLWPQVSAITASGALPIAVWEFSLGVYLIVKGFRPSPITEGPTPVQVVPETPGNNRGTV
jgi:Domain of unknown function (DUF4386)